MVEDERHPKIPTTARLYSVVHWLLPYQIEAFQRCFVSFPIVNWLLCMGWAVPYTTITTIMTTIFSSFFLSLVLAFLYWSLLLPVLLYDSRLADNLAEMALTLAMYPSIWFVENGKITNAKTHRCTLLATYICSGFLAAQCPHSLFASGGYIILVSSSHPFISHIFFRIAGWLVGGSVARKPCGSFTPP